MREWWMTEEYDRSKPMVFSRRDCGPQQIIVMPPSEKEIEKAPKNETPAHHRVRVFVGR